MPRMEERSNVSKVTKSCGAYKFRIEGFSGLSTKIGDSVESPEFSLCGHQWQLRIFPGGSLESHKGFVSFYLASKSATLARASYKLIVENQIPGGEDESFISSGVRIFEPKGVQVDGWGRDKFMTHVMMSDSSLGFSLDDAVIFKVELTVFGDLQAAVAPRIDNFVADKTHALDACLQKLFADSIGSDITLVVGGPECGGDVERMPAHKCILMARSPVFQAMFSCNMIESHSEEVVIPDIAPKVMKEVLQFMYTDKMASNALLSEMAVPLLLAALKYQVSGLVDACESYFYSQLNDDTVITILMLADTYGALKLKQKALQYVSQHAAKVTASKEYGQLDDTLRQESDAAVEVATKRFRLRGGSVSGGSHEGGERRKKLAGCSIM